MVAPYKLFSVFGIELEYMVVDRDSLDIRPIVDVLFSDHLADSRDSSHIQTSSALPSDVEFPDITWSNELTAHVLELKTSDPAASLSTLGLNFSQHVTYLNQLLSAHNAMLLGTAMHPWMNPQTETKLWPHGYNQVYEAFNKIFNCRGHGWSNLQSVHLNLPFQTESDFGALHAAIRVVLPLIPTLAASSPIYDGSPGPNADSRLHFYSENSKSIPSVAGQIIPEPIFSFRDYQEKILNRIYADLAPFDSERILEGEWVNARGAIARFERSSIEIRLIDIQEYPKADLANCALVAAVLKHLIAGKWADPHLLKGMPITTLVANLKNAIRDAEDTILEGPTWLRLFGITDNQKLRASDLWAKLIQDLEPELRDFKSELELYLQCGTLAKRIVRALGGNYSREALKEVYRELAKCLAENRAFIA